MKKKKIEIEISEFEVKYQVLFILEQGSEGLGLDLVFEFQVVLNHVFELGQQSVEVFYVFD